MIRYVSARRPSNDRALAWTGLVLLAVHGELRAEVLLRGKSRARHHGLERFRREAGAGFEQALVDLGATIEHFTGHLVAAFPTDDA